jgi:signal transduction histidine kinase
LISLRRARERRDDPAAAAPATAADSPSHRRELDVFVAVALLGLVAVGAASAVLCGELARDAARDEAEISTVRLARSVVAPFLGDDEDPEQRAALDTVIEHRMSDGELLRVVVWTADGQVVYSSDPRLEGDRREVSPELRRALMGETVSEVDEDPQAELPETEGPVLEVYTPLRVDDQRLAFEAYFSGQMVQRNTARLRRELLPLTIGGLVVLQAVQIPIAVRMGRRLTRQEADRRTMVQEHLKASDRERREIAADLHDGPVQDLAGVSYALSALKMRLPEDQASGVDRMVGAVRSAVASLRRLMVDIYPPDLSGPGLVPAMEDLAGTVREKGIDAEVVAGDVPEMPQATAAVLYRSAKEALANVVRHSGAESVRVELGRSEAAGRGCVRLTVADDGRGLGDLNGDGLPVSRDDDKDHHLGLRLIRDRVVEAGGTLVITSRPEGGTVMEVDVPVSGNAPR